MAFVTPTDRPKSVHNRCVIEVFGGVFVLSRSFLDFSVGVGAFVIALSQISSVFVQRRAKNRPLSFRERGCFSNKKHDSYKCWTCAELCEAFTFLMENIYVQFEGMVYQQIVEITFATNCALLIADLFYYCVTRGILCLAFTNLHSMTL